MFSKSTTITHRRRVFRRLYLCLFVLVLIPFSTHAHETLHEQIVAITRKIKRDPQNASLYLQRGELYRLDRNWVRSNADYDRALHLQPSLSVVHLARGRMLLEARRFRQARIALDRFLREQPDNAEALVTRARVLAALRARVEAADDYTRAIARAPVPEPELYIERARVLAGDKRHQQEALRGLDEGIARLGPLVTLQLAAIDLELRQKNYDGALSRLELITAQSERKEVWLFRRGEILKAAGRNEDARAAFAAALAAIEALPPGRRQSRTIISLQLQARSALKL